MTPEPKPAVVKQEHKDLWAKIAPLAFASASSPLTDFSHDNAAAQLIADAEARAINEALTPERIHYYCLRYLTPNQVAHLFGERMTEICNEAIARAEKAEAQLHALRLVCGTTDANKFQTWVDRANERAEKAEADAQRLLAEAQSLRDQLRSTAQAAISEIEKRTHAEAELKDANEVSEGRRITLLEKEEQLRKEWQRAEKAEAEAAEQARLNGMGSEREARLLAQVEELRKKLEGKQ